MGSNTFTSEHWGPYLQTIELPDGEETVLDGGERDFGLLVEPFQGIGKLAVVGYSSQGPAHAQNLRDSFEAGGVPTQVVVALRKDSPTRERARRDGFTEENGTLVTPEVALRTADMALMLISDAAMAEHGQDYLAMMKPGAVLGLAHGFFPGFLATRGEHIRDDLRVVGVCPKGMGPSVRRLYEQGHGINASAAWDNDGDRDLALGWAYGIGAPFTFRTTLDMERKSDLVGERAILLGGVHALVEAAYAHKRQHDVGPAEAYRSSVESLVRGISTTISENGLRGVYDALNSEDKEEFERAYNAAYPAFRTVTEQTYREVESGREVEQVYEEGMANVPMSNVAGADMWRVGEKVRVDETEPVGNYDKIDATVAGLYVAGMMAQIDVFREHGHFWSEVVNESVIEAIDSLNPFMRARGIDYMVDNCSITARRGARKWAPIVKAWLEQEVFPRIDGTVAFDSGEQPFAQFSDHPAHDAFTELSKLRPTVSIAVE